MGHPGVPILPVDAVAVVEPWWSSRVRSRLAAGRVEDAEVIWRRAVAQSHAEEIPGDVVQLVRGVAWRGVGGAA